MAIQAKVLVVDDEPHILTMLRTCLEGSGYQVLEAYNGTEGLRVFFQHRPDLVILDIIMPGMDGIELCQRIREVSPVPVLFLSAKAAEQDKVKGLNLGADDYITKPVGMKELRARVEAALRRARMPPTGETETLYQDDAITIDFARREVFLQGEPVELTPTEYRLLVYLAQNAGRVLTTDQILDQVWGKGYESPDAVKGYISHLREKLKEDPVSPRLIITVRGTGYRYEKPHLKPTPP